MAEFTLKLKGMGTINAALNRVAREYPEDIRGAMFRQGEKIMGRSKEEFVPHKEGHLKDSGHVVEDGDRVLLVFGGMAAPYAIVQHENKKFRHPRGGSAKYLERPLLEAARTFARDLANECELGKAAR